MTAPVPGAAPGRSAGASYDEVPYESHAIANTSPDAMATMGILFGMRPAPVPACRVLELGCAGAGNLVAMAVPLPEARFVGIDASPLQIEAGRALVREVGVGNVELTVGDLMDLPPQLGEFDYIVCHGVYSWVPPRVQEAILEIFARHLAPNGIAYLSYNTYPGCHLRDMAREMMRFHVRAVADPAEKTAQARSFVDFLNRFQRNRDGIYEKILASLSEQISEEPDWYVFHEYLEDHNGPVYFSELALEAAARGLQYLAPASFIAWEHRLPTELEGILGQLSNRIVREQYLDFLGARMFRRTLFCRSAVSISPTPLPEAIKRLHAIGRPRRLPSDPGAQPEAEDASSSPAAPDPLADQPLIEAALAALAEAFPRAIPFLALLPLVSRRLPPEVDGAARSDALAAALLRCHLVNGVTLRTWVPPLVLSPGERPVASPLARLQAARNRPVVNLRHKNLDLGDLDQVVLELLDGTRDRAALSDTLAGAVAAGRLGIEDAAGARLEDPERVREVVAGALEESLARLAAGSLLTA